MRRLIKRVIWFLVKCSLLLAFYAALAIGGYKLLKSCDRAAGLGLWPAEPSLESIDPLEREEAAERAAKKYRGVK